MKQPKKRKRTDGQLTELVGTSLLQSILLADGIEVAKPVRDRGVDLVAYLDLQHYRELSARNLQIKAASKEAFGFDSKYKKFPKLAMVHAWHVRDYKNARFFVTDYAETMKLVGKYKKKKTGKTQKWNTSRPSEELKNNLAEYEVKKGQWKKRLFGRSQTRRKGVHR